jgi:hypothetical protein
MGMRIQVHAPIMTIILSSSDTLVDKLDYNVSDWIPLKSYI